MVWVFDDHLRAVQRYDDAIAGEVRKEYAEEAAAEIEGAEDAAGAVHRAARHRPVALVTHSQYHTARRPARQALTKDSALLVEPKPMVPET